MYVELQVQNRQSETPPVFNWIPVHPVHPSCSGQSSAALCFQPHDVEPGYHDQALD